MSDSMLSSSAPVGQRGGGFSVNLRMTVPVNSWREVSGACLVGASNNLVVDAVPSLYHRREGPQPLIVTGPSAVLCQWLSGRTLLHESLKEKWEAALRREKSQYGWWRLWKRFSLWMKTFPDITISATVTYVDFTDGDESPFAAPWFTATFAYEPPPPRDGFGIFDDIVGHFAPYPGAAPKEVTLLLNPSSTYNMALPMDKQSTSVEEQIINVLSALGRDVEHPQQTRAAFHVFRSSYVDQPVTMTLKLADFWNYGGDCMIRGVFLAQLYDRYRTMCAVVNDASRDFVTAYISDKIDIFSLSVRQMDLFSGTVPAITATISVKPPPGAYNTYLEELQGQSVELGILSDPSLRKRFSQAQKILANFRWLRAKGLVEGIANPEIFLGSLP
ncbi:hypothetical protein BESB_080930 [Besnoitia besnoiti]|uniref:Dense granule protein GRA12 n=1 Tax=Besnoitia besnoiti TaxID=94643 RepID=A0A2A9ME24_BESBE|nr:hypothetical protein BESB_080930 [Besnoitia besnoiti]PFH33877.1 hypothetical protein BESB_080930 [Besnoitia besnoiti]